MNGEKIRALIIEIERITGSCYFNESEIDDTIDTFEITVDEYGNMGIEIDVETLKVSPYIAFSYYDFKKSDIEKGHYDVEELEQDLTTKLLESSFTLFLKAHSPDYIVSVWDDGCYMCPGYVARVGFQNQDYSEELIQAFLYAYQEYTTNFSNLSDNALRIAIFKAICHNHGVKVAEDLTLMIKDASIKFTENTCAPQANVDHYYIGSEKFLLSVLGKQYAVDVLPIKIFIETHEMCESFSEVAFFLEHPPLFDYPVLYATSPHMQLTVQARSNDGHIFTYIEESATIMSHSSLIPFASDHFKRAYFETYSRTIDSFLGESPLIITEGSTDWKHLKKFWEQYLRYSLNVSFHEYEPKNSAGDVPIKLDMGSVALLEMCKAFSKMNQKRTFIFIADSDEPKIVKEMGGGVNLYKYWGNHVYSLVLPVPDHRKATPEICIEHYYSDEEIKTFYKCSDGQERRLFLGNDFDMYGRNIEQGLLCTKRNMCGPQSIKVVDGSSDAKVISMREATLINYALSKQEFAVHATIMRESITYNAFLKLFDIIRRIVNREISPE